MNTLAITVSDRPAIVDAGLIPANLAGTWSVRKLSSGYMFMEYTTYNGHSYFATINNSILSDWNEVAHNSKIAYRSVGLPDVLTRDDGSTDISGRMTIVGNQITIVAQLGGLSLSAGQTKIGVLSKGAIGFNTVVTAIGTVGSASVMGTFVRVAIDNSGNIFAYAESAVSGTLRFTVSYGTTDANVPT